MSRSNPLLSHNPAMTSIDSNVLIIFGRAGDPANQRAASALARAASIGPLCICGAVFTELLGFPNRTGDHLRSYLDPLRIDVDWQMEEKDWEVAGNAYQGYVARRWKSGGGLPRRVATDFLIGAHAAVRGYTLLTMDKGLYRSAFPTLHIESL